MSKGVDEDALMRRAAAGDSQAFGQLVGRYQQEAARFALRMLNDGEATRDVTQDAFLRVWRARREYRAAGKFREYLLRVVHNACLDHLRASASAISLSSLEEQGQEREDTRSARVDVAAERQILLEEVREALKMLPQEQRAVFILSCWEGLAYREIADVLDCPLGTVASRKAQAMETLRRRLHPWRDEDNALG